MVASFASALISCFSSAVVASLCTLAIERFGGTIGGILASSPTTIIVFSIGQTLSKSIPDVQHALYAVQFGIASNAVFLIMWREIPDLHAFQHAACLQSLAAKLALIVVVSLSVWTICATLMLLLLNATQSWNWNFRVVGIFFFLVSISFGIAIASWKYVPSPKGNYKPHWFVYVLRGVLAGVAVGSAVLLSRVSDFISGIASAFPAILMTSMVSLWISQGTAVQGGAVAPLILGTAAVSAFALTYAELVPLLAARGTLGSNNHYLFGIFVYSIYLSQLSR
jgi:hypothetical protein